MRYRALPANAWGLTMYLEKLPPRLQGSNKTDTRSRLTIRADIPEALAAPEGVVAPVWGAAGWDFLVARVPGARLVPQGDGRAAVLGGDV